MFFLRADFRFSFRQGEEPLVYGFRYFNITDDFINESAAGLPNSSSDKRYTTRVGPYIDYLFSPHDDRTYYLSGALYQTTVKISCDNESDSDSSPGIYFGGGYRLELDNGFGYNIGVLVSPFVRLSQTTTNCSSDSSGDVDIRASLTYRF